VRPREIICHEPTGKVNSVIDGDAMAAIAFHFFSPAFG